MKQWNRPELENLGLQNTKTPTSKCIQIGWICQRCTNLLGKNPFYKPQICDKCSSTDIKYTGDLNGAVVTLPDFTVKDS